MSRWLVFVTLFVPQLQTGNCLYAGDSCVAEDRSGDCRELSECAPLYTEIQNAGTPMPSRLRRKLQSLSCGFIADQPLVCCVTPFTNVVTETNVQDWSPPVTHDVTGGGQWQQAQPAGGTVDWDSDNTGHQNSNSDSNRQTPERPGVFANSNINSPPDIRGHRNLNLLPDDCGVVESDKIYGGNRTRLFEMPWMVLVSYNSARGTKLSCGGTLITERYVLTAAHCVTFLGNRLTLNGMILGEHDVRTDPDCERVEGELNCAPNVRNISIERVIPHPGYSPQNLYDDIALVKLSEPGADFTTDSMKPICLPTTPELQSESLVGANGIVAGWGATEDGLQSPVLLSVDLPVLSNNDCETRFNGSPQIYNRQLCAGGVEDKDSCGGDSGGPLIYPGRTRSRGVRYVQRGIVSYGSKRCGLGGFPGVYTRVAYYMDWILDNIRN